MPPDAAIRPIPSASVFGGTAVWRTDSIAQSAGQAPEVAIRADIEIPEESIGVRWTLRSNFVDTSRPHSAKDHITVGEMTRFRKAALGGG
jgi:hypothetical protein